MIQHIEEMIPVKEYHGLCRDTTSNSIINVDKESYLKAKIRKESSRKQKLEYDEIKKQIASLIDRCDALEHLVLRLSGINN